MLEETGILGGVPRRQPDVALTGEQQHRLPELGDGRPGGDRVERTFGVVERHCDCCAGGPPWTGAPAGVNVLIDASDDWCKWMAVRLFRVPLNFGGGPHDRQAAITLS